MTDIVIFFTVLAPMLVAIGFAASLRRFDFVRGTRVAPNIAKIADDLSLKVFFPTFVLSAFIGADLTVWPQMNIVVGVSVPVVCLVIALVASRLLPRLVPLETALASSTFGAGNRGMLMIMVLFGNEHDATNYVTNFSFLDVGHAIFIIGLIPLILPFMFGRSTTSTTAWHPARWIDNYLLITLAWVGTIFALIELSIVDVQTMRDWLNISQEWRKNIFTFMLFVSIFIKTRLTTDLGSLLRLGVTFAALRAFLLALFLPITQFFSNNASLATVLIVYILSPPASILPAMVAKSAASRGIIEGVAEKTVVLNIVFVIALLTIVFGKAILASS